MAEILDLSKSVHDLAEEHCGFIDVMVTLGFSDIAKPAALATVGRVMTVPKGASIKGIPLAKVIRTFQEAGYEVIGLPGTTAAKSAESIEPEEDEASIQNEAPSNASFVTGSNEADARTPEEREKLLRSYVERLSAGEALENVRRDFVANFSEVDAAEIAHAEQDLIEGGVAIEDVQRLCDVHSALFHGATHEEHASAGDVSSIANASDFKCRILAAIPGHPVHVFLAENDAIATQIARVREVIDAPEGKDELERLGKLSIHYAKKGDLLYPPLKTRHAISGPSDVMWGVDDEIRVELGIVAAALPEQQDEAWHKRVNAVLKRAEEMCYKEANILMPLCAENYSDEEWLQMYADMKGYDLCLIEDAGVWQTGETWIRNRARAVDNAEAAKAKDLATQTAELQADPEGRAEDDEDRIHLPSGSLTPAQLDALLNTLPLEITFIDDHEINRYWNDDGHKKLFKRPSAALGREVYSCHPPKVQKMVRNVIESLRSGKKDSVDIWMHKEGEPVLVRYMAVRDRGGAYVGTMECVQRMGFARKHFSK